MNSVIKIIGDVISQYLRKPMKIIGTIFSLSTLFFMVFLLMMLVSFTLQSVDKAENQISITFFLKENIPSYKIATLRAKVMNMEKKQEIKNFIYRSSEETIQQFSQNQPDRYQFLQENIGNGIPLSPSITVTPGSADIESLIYFFVHGDFKDSIDTEKLARSSDQIIQSKKVLEFLGFLKIGIIGIILLVLLGTSIITASFISTIFHSRKNEIFIMRLVGGSASFIRMPFIIEGIFITILSLALGWSLFFILRYTTITEMMTVFSSLEEKILVATSINQMWQEFLLYIPALILIIIIFTLIATFITLERLLQRKDILG